jgi:hypothetical protein
MDLRYWIALLATMLLAAPFFGNRSPGGHAGIDPDEQILKDAGIETDPASLLAFFRSRSLSEASRRELQVWIRDLGNELFSRREAASSHLARVGPAALPSLNVAIHDPDPELARRAQFCLESIQRGPGPGVAAAAVRLLAARRAEGSLQVLLDYMPFCDEESVEEEVLTALTALVPCDGKPELALVEALHDPVPARRGAAALILGGCALPAIHEQVHRLLQDPDASVRLRTAQGLLSARDADAPPTLIGLLTDSPPNVARRAEEFLLAIAAERPPAVSLGAGDAESGRKCRAAWTSWLGDPHCKIDWRGIRDPRRSLGLTVIAEMSTNRVWEAGSDGKPRWVLDNLQGPMDAQVLPRGRVLIAENHGQRVTERDFKGRVLWEKRVNGDPVSCQRLPNGNTFVAMYQGIVEVTPDGREIFQLTRPQDSFIFGAQKLANGNVIWMSGQGAVTEVNSQGAEVRTMSLVNPGVWAGLEVLAENRFLVALPSLNKVVELNAQGKTLWQCTSVPRPCYATRLADGQTLIASLAGRVVTVDAAGKTLMEVPTAGRPMHARRR